MKAITKLEVVKAAALSALFVGGLVAGGIAQAEGGNATAGKDKAAVCGGCHGEDGNSASGEFPRLASQYENYIVKQVTDFQNQRRTNNETMAGMAATIADVQDAKDIGAYFSQQKMAKDPIVAVDKKLASVGEKLFNEGNPKSGIYACVNCHGKNGKGKAKDISVFPVIGGQHKDYIVKELKDFREGRRTNDPAGMMSDIAKKLQDADIEALANYLSSL